MKPARIAPSLLAADFAHLAEDVQRIENEVEMLHLDVMDGHFVPNISFGMPVIASLRAATSVYFDCHLMTTNPDAYLEELKEAGADLVTMHIEVVPNPDQGGGPGKRNWPRFRTGTQPAHSFRGGGALRGVGRCAPHHVGSRRFRRPGLHSEVLPKLETARKFVDSHGLPVDIQVDGGITAETAPLAREAGADVFVAGTAIFRDPDPVGAVHRLRNAIESVE